MPKFDIDQDIIRLFGGIILVILSIIYLKKEGDVQLVGQIMIALSAFYVGSALLPPKK